MDMNTELPSTPSPRRVDLSYLPAAVKTHIARLCAEQDHALEASLALPRETATADFANALEIFDRRRNGSNIGNLFCVSKEWSTLAAPFRFQTLKLRQLRAAIFAMRIIHLRGQHFKVIDLVDAKLPDLIRFLGLLPRMPNIRTVASSDFRVAAATRAPYIEMDPPETACVESGMKQLFDLDRLDLEFAGDFRTLDKQLTTLLASAATAGELPQLRQLILSSPDVSPAVLHFVSLFAPTLSHLALIFTSYCVHFLPQAPQGAVGLSGPFPHLEGLILEGDATALEGPLGSLTDDNMPCLKRFIYIPDELPPVTERRPGEPPIPTPRRLIPLDQFGFHPIKPVPSTLDLKQLPAAQLPTKKLHRGQAAYRGVLSYSRGPAKPATSEFKVVKGRVRTTLRFLRNWRKRAKSQQDAASLVKMAQALCDVELERIAYEA